MHKSPLALFSFLLLLPWAAPSAFAQQDHWYPSAYHGIPERHKAPVFIEEFENNKRHWASIQTSFLRAGIYEGTYRWVSHSDFPPRASQTVDIDERFDFEIELKLRFRSGRESAFNGISWGRSPRNHHGYYFGFAGDGSCLITKYAQNSFEDLLPWKYESAVDVIAYNKLTIRKVRREYYFFINESLVHRAPYEPFFGDEVEFVLANFSEVSVDYLCVHRLQQPEQDLSQLYDPEDVKTAWIDR